MCDFILRILYFEFHIFRMEKLKCEIEECCGCLVVRADRVR
jgi:hypothetical protein